MRAQRQAKTDTSENCPIWVAALCNHTCFNNLIPLFFYGYRANFNNAKRKSDISKEKLNSIQSSAVSIVNTAR